MANREKGEIDVTVEDRVYTLRPTFDAICELETVTGGKTVDARFEDSGAGRLSGLRACVWCLLQDQHGEEIRTLKDASEWITKAGGPVVVMAHLADVRDLNTEPAEVAEVARTRPRKAQAGTGKRSS